MTFVREQMVTFYKEDMWHIGAFVAQEGDIVQLVTGPWGLLKIHSVFVLPISSQTEAENTLNNAADRLKEMAEIFKRGEPFDLDKAGDRIFEVMKVLDRLYKTFSALPYHATQKGWEWVEKK